MLKDTTPDGEPDTLEAYYGLPSKIQFCSRCVISNQRPSSTVEFKSNGERKETIAFDDDGVCAACRYADIKEHDIDWDERDSELRDLCNRYRRNDGRYDCVVPGSGGKDSAFTAHILKYRYDMHPLTVTWSPHKYTNIGWRNFQSWIDSGLDNVLFTPNGKVHRLLTRLAFENLLHPFQPFIVGQRMIAPRFSVLYDIPLVFYGENQAEYGNNVNDNFIPIMDPKYYTGTGNFDCLRLGGVSAEELLSEFNLDRNELEPYLPIASERLEKTATCVHYLGYYIKWDPQECYYYASENTGFQANDERTEGSYSKYSSIDDRIDPLHYYTTFIKFGIGRATYDAAQEIRNGKITREEGVALVKRYDAEFPHMYLNEMLGYMDINLDRFEECIDKGRSPHLWIRDNGQWKLRHAVWMDNHRKGEVA